MTSINQEIDYTDAPLSLQAALESLSKVSDNDLIDHFSNDTAQNYRATIAIIDNCFELLCEIETSAKEAVKSEAARYRARLKSIESLGLEMFIAERSEAGS